MTRRTQEQWLSLFEEQKHSGLTQTEFCEGLDISPKYFSLRKSQLKTTGNEVVHQRTHLKLPISLSADWLAQFVQQLG